MSDNFLISVSDPDTPGSQPTALQDIVRKDQDLTIKEDCNRQNITVFICGLNSNLTVIYRGSGGAFNQDTVSGVLAGTTIIVGSFPLHVRSLDTCADLNHANNSRTLFPIY